MDTFFCGVKRKRFKLSSFVVAFVGSFFIMYLVAVWKREQFER